MANSRLPRARRCSQFASRLGEGRQAISRARGWCGTRIDSRTVLGWAGWSVDAAPRRRRAIRWSAAWSLLSLRHPPRAAEPVLSSTV
jgi:hypothetical protein